MGRGEKFRDHGESGLLSSEACLNVLSALLSLLQLRSAIGEPSSFDLIQKLVDVISGIVQSNYKVPWLRHGLN